MINDTTGAVEQPDYGQTQDSSPESASQELQSNQSTLESRQVAQAIQELEKIGRFKFQGEEYNTESLKQAILRQKDYTTKTQKLSEERKSFDGERKYYENLVYDLDLVRTSPTNRNIQAFLSTYPEKFHSYLKQVLTANQSQQSAQVQPQGQSQNGSQPDVELLSRLTKLEGVLHAQEVSKNETQLNSQIDKYSKKYPDAVAEQAIGRIFEAYNSTGQKPTAEQWEQAFKESHEQQDARFKAKYGNLVKEQSTANKKAKDVPAGGGTVGQAPKKFNSLKDVTRFAVGDLSKTRST